MVQKRLSDEAGEVEEGTTPSTDETKSAKFEAPYDSQNRGKNNRQRGPRGRSDKSERET